MKKNPIRLISYLLLKLVWHLSIYDTVFNIIFCFFTFQLSLVYLIVGENRNIFFLHHSLFTRALTAFFFY